MNSLSQNLPEGIAIQGARETDIQELHQLINSAYRGESSKIGWTTEADLLDGQRVDPTMLLEMIQTPDTQLLILKDQEYIQACVYLKKADSHSAYLGLLTVNPNIQNKGLGRILLEYSERWIPYTWKLPNIIMNVISTRSELIAWYERRGYAQTGKTSEFPMNDPKFGIPRTEKIIFTELSKTLS